MTLTREVLLETGFNEGSDMVGRDFILKKKHRLRKGERAEFGIRVWIRSDRGPGKKDR